jgi:aubergine-like protein
MTSYNKKTYRVDEVEFNMSPRDTFSVNEVETSYVDYYQSKY